MAFVSFKVTLKLLLQNLKGKFQIQIISKLDWNRLKKKKKHINPLILGF